MTLFGFGSAFVEDVDQKVVKSILKSNYVGLVNFYKL